MHPSYILLCAVVLLLWWTMSSSSLSSCSTDVTISSHRHHPPVPKTDRQPLHEHETRLIDRLHAHILHAQTGPLKTTITHTPGKTSIHTKGVDFDKLTKCDLVKRQNIIQEYIPHASQFVHGRGSVWTWFKNIGHNVEATAKKLESKAVKGISRGARKAVSGIEKGVRKIFNTVNHEARKTIANVGDVVIDLKVQEKLCEHKNDIDMSTIDLLLKQGKKTGALQETARKYGFPTSVVEQLAKQINANVKVPSASTMTFNGMNHAGQVVGLPHVGTKAHAKFQGIQKTVFDKHNQVYKLVRVKQLQNPGLQMSDTVDNMCYNIEKHFNIIKGAQPACKQVKGCCKKVIAPPIPYRTKRSHGGFCCPNEDQYCNK